MALVRGQRMPPRVTGRQADSRPRFTQRSRASVALANDGPRSFAALRLTLSADVASRRACVMLCVM